MTAEDGRAYKNLCELTAVGLDCRILTFFPKEITHSTDYSVLGAGC